MDSFSPSRSQLSAHDEARIRRYGLKALRGDQLCQAASHRASQKRSISMLAFSVSPKLVITICLVAVLLSAGGFILHKNQQSALAKAKVVEYMKAKEAVRVKSLEADECRRKKAQEKAHLIGTITYDELYDNGACDR